MRLYPDLTVDEEYFKLGELGHTGSLNDRQKKALETIGHTGSISDGFKKFRDEGNFNPYLLNAELFVDPSDTSTLFQDAAGTTPVTSAGDPVGLVLDKSQGLARGAEVLSNPNFEMASDWVSGSGATLTYASDQITVSSDPGDTFAAAYQDQATIAGMLYELVVDLDQLSADGRIGVSSISGTAARDLLDFGLVSSTGEFRGFFTGTGAMVYVQLGTVGDASSAVFNSASLKPIPGNHLTAPSGAARPTYQTGGGLHWLEFDGVDDELATAAALPFSAQVFNCTAFRLDAYNSSFPEVITSRGNSVATSQRHPILTLPQSSPNNVRVNYGDSGGGLGMGEAALGLGVVVSSYADGTGRNIEANGQSQTGTGPTLTSGSTDPFIISGNNRFSGRFYGTVQVNAVPSASQIDAARKWFAQRSGGIA